MVSPTIQKILIVLVVLIGLGFLGYNLFSTTGDVATSATDVLAEPTVGQDILNLVNDLRTVNIDQKIFSSDLFTNLKDFGVTLYPEPQGRPNPFAVIGGLETLPLGNTAGRVATSTRR